MKYLFATAAFLTCTALSAQNQNSSTNFWKKDANGIHLVMKKKALNIGIGTPSHSFIPLTILGPDISSGGAIMQLSSYNSWHSALTITNGPDPNRYTLVVGGYANKEVRPDNFGIYNHHTPGWAMVIEGSSNNIGIGYNSGYSIEPKSRLHVFNGDINIDQVGSGIIMKSPNGKCWRVTIDNDGNFVRTEIECLN